MMETPITFESQFRERLLDIVYGQWGLLGIPFSPGNENEVIDPEALIWASLEFFPFEPRLCEKVRLWVYGFSKWILRQRAKTHIIPEDPRAGLWKAIDKRGPIFKTSAASEPFYGMGSIEEATEHIQAMQRLRIDTKSVVSVMLGEMSKGPATLMLKTREMLGLDARHCLLVFLLAHPNGAMLRDVREWSGYSYRTLSDASFMWEMAGILLESAAQIRLNDPEPFKRILNINSEIIVLVDWWSVFSNSVRLLRDLAKARSKGFNEASVIQTTLRKEAKAVLKKALWPSGNARNTSVHKLLELFPE